MFKKSFLRGFIIIILLVISVPAIQVQADDQNMTIRAENADEVEQLAVFYHNNIQQVGWAENSESFYVTDSTAIWLQNAKALDMPSREFQGHARLATNMVISLNNAYRAIVRRNNDIQIWSEHDNSLLATLSSQAETINMIIFSPDSTHILVASNATTVTVWNIETAQPEIILQGHVDSVLDTSYDPTGQTIATASADGTVRLWNATNGDPLAVLAGHTEAVVTIEFSREGSVIASASVDGTIRLWNTTDFSEIGVLDNHTASLTHLSFSPDGVYLLSASADHTARLWAVAS